MRGTLASYDAYSCAEALQAAGSLYRELRSKLAPTGLETRDPAEEAVLAYLAARQAFTQKLGRKEP